MARISNIGGGGSGGGGGGGGVSSVSVVTANGVSGSVANPTTTPAITLSLGNITPTSDTSVIIDKSENVYDVKAYGAKCDGSTDDTSAIQTTLNTAAAAGGGTVLIPNNSVISNITIDSYVELRGASQGTTLLAKTGATGYMIALTTPSTSQQIAIRNITLKPNKTGLGGVNIDNTGFTSSTDSLHELENVIVTNSVGDAFHFDNAVREIRVNRCKAYFTTNGYGFYIGTGCTDSRFTDNTAGTSSKNGFQILGNNNSFVGCKSFWAGYNGTSWGTTQSGFFINNLSYVHMASCEAQQAALHGFDIQSCSRIAIVGCSSDTNSAGTTGGVGFNTVSTTNSSLVGCTGSNNGSLSPGSQAFGVQVTGTQTGLSIIGNSVTGSSGNLGYVSGGGYFYIDYSVSDFTGIPVKMNDVTLFALAGASSGATTFTPAATASGTITVPSATDTMALLAASQALSNKTYTGTAIGINTGLNAGIAQVLTTGSDSVKGIVVFPNSATQSASLLEVQNSSFSPVFTVDKAGATVVNTLNGLTVTTSTGTLNIANGKTAKFDNTLEFAGTDSTVMTFPSTSATVVGTTQTQTLTNKRNTRRLTAVTQSATPSINTDNMDIANITGLAQAITSMTTNLTGTPNDGDRLEVRITDNGTARAITWGTSFEATTVALPLTTVISTMLRVGFEWNATASKWDCIATA